MVAIVIFLCLQRFSCKDTFLSNIQQVEKTLLDWYNPLHDLLDSEMRMKVNIAYGKSGLQVSVPDSVRLQVVEPAYLSPLPDDAGAVKDSLAHPFGSFPLSEEARGARKVAIVTSDITRPVPNRVILPLVIEELERAGVPERNIIICIGTGTHRLQTREELDMMLGSDIASRFRIVQNDSRNPDSFVEVGRASSGYDAFLNREFMGCDLKVLTGFVEPHFFAGFSGGAKAVMPGMASLDTVMRNHGARNIDDPRSTWGVIDGNPLRAEIEGIARMAGRLFIVNVTLNRDKRITGVFSGSLEEAYPRACEFERKQAMVQVEEPFDIVITSNSGFPLDLNLYQSVKGMSAADQVRKEGGAIIMAAECWDGIPDHGSFGKLLTEEKTPDALLSLIRQDGFCRDDQWQAQILARILKRGPVFLKASGLSNSQIRNAMLEPCNSIEQKLDELIELYGAAASVCILPEGPQTIPYLSLSNSL